MDGHCALPCTSKHYNALNFDGLAKNRQKSLAYMMTVLLESI